MSIESDADYLPTDTDTSGVEKKTGSGTTDQDQKSQTFQTSGGPTTQPRQASASATMANTAQPRQASASARNANKKAPTYNLHFVDGGLRAPTKFVTSKFNFVDSVVHNAALGNEGPVTFNNTKTVYEAGAKKTDFNISGGNFNQANFGKKATYENKDSTLNAGETQLEDAKQQQRQDDFIDINECQPPFSPEEYLAKLLSTGITSEDLVRLLKKDFNIVTLAYCIPPCSVRQEAMIEALLRISEMKNEQTL